MQENYTSKEKYLEIYMSKVCNYCNKQRKEFCVCGDCNHCHLGGWNLNDKSYQLHWYHSVREGGTPILVTLGQSHGGHGWIPDYQLCGSNNSEHEECEI